MVIPYSVMERTKNVGLFFRLIGLWAKMRDKIALYLFLFGDLFKVKRLI